ncbi:MAG: hypothetical protein OXH00_04430 [Candidatus Poribacteria bacterium]|nr:hypothetical protein [Candidatus Poribacteria bacterium]
MPTTVSNCLRHDGACLLLYPTAYGTTARAYYCIQLLTARRRVPTTVSNCLRHDGACLLL